MEVLKVGDLVTIDDLLSPYYGHLGMVVDTVFYNENLSIQNPGTGHPDSYSCDVLVQKNCKKTMIRAKFLKKV
tara:strand:- start:771 stop:989 length:219 start_codon:yes stop_codon:yes gene_type:complete